MQELHSAQADAITAALDGMRSAYNRFEIQPCYFTGEPEDLSALDYIPYELPMTEEYAAGSLAFGLVFGNVLTTSFGFHWVSPDGDADPRSIAVFREDPSVLVFPYYRLREIEESSCCLDNAPAQTLWFDTMRYFDRCGYVPDGWHPVFDAANSPASLGCPASLTKACQRLIDNCRDFYYTMSTYPYTWARNEQWDKLCDYADTLATNAVRT